MLSTTQFFAPPERIQGDRLTLPPEEARHASKVLRASRGDEIEVVDGAGGWYRVVLDHTGGDIASGHVVERRREVGEAPYALTLAFGLIKQRSRMETLLEKAVELGVTRAVPLITEHTEKETVREARLEKIVVAAMKQCGRSRRMILGDVEPFEAFVEREPFDVGLCCHEGASSDAGILDALTREHEGVPSEFGNRPSSVPGGKALRFAALVGPEGGFTGQEVEHAAAAGYRTVSLGPRRLRAETAAISVAAAISLAWDSGHIASRYQPDRYR